MMAIMWPGLYKHPVSVCHHSTGSTLMADKKVAQSKQPVSVCYAKLLL